MRVNGSPATQLPVPDAGQTEQRGMQLPQTQRPNVPNTKSDLSDFCNTFEGWGSLYLLNLLAHLHKNPHTYTH